MDIFNTGPGHKAGVCLFDILGELLDGPLSQDTKGNAHLLCSSTCLHGNQEVDVCGHILVKGCCPQVKCPPGLLLVEFNILELRAADCLLMSSHRLRMRASGIPNNSTESYETVGWQYFPCCCCCHVEAQGRSIALQFYPETASDTFSSQSIWCPRLLLVFLWSWQLGEDGQCMALY